MGMTRQDTIYVTNFPYHFEEKDLESLFSECGKLVSVRMPSDRMTLKHKGFAFITFDNSRSARKALNINGHKIMDKSLKVSLADNKKPDERPPPSRD